MYKSHLKTVWFCTDHTCPCRREPVTLFPSVFKASIIKHKNYISASISDVTVFTKRSCTSTCVCAHSTFPLQLACVCMCWNLGHPLWLCVWEADQSIWGAARHMGVFEWGHAHTGLHLPLCVCEPRRKSIYCMRCLGCLGCFHCTNTLQRNKYRRRFHLNCTHTDVCTLL